MIPAQELKSIAKKLNISQPQSIEKDWILGHILNAVYLNPLLSKGLVFKGGTCLRKCWFKDYRFSGDLDFTIIEPSLANKNTLFQELTKVCQAVEQVGIACENVEIEQTRDEYGEEAFLAKIPFAAILTPPRILPKIRLDMTRYEIVLLPIARKTIIHPYSDANEVTATVHSYSLEEILAEKMRTMLQRVYPRDVYDVGTLLADKTINFMITREIFVRKCQFKKVKFTGIGDFFQGTKLASTKKAWQASLVHLVSPLPRFETVMQTIQERLSDLFNQ